jgi:hypothetical protein
VQSGTLFDEYIPLYRNIRVNIMSIKQLTIFSKPNVLSSKKKKRGCKRTVPFFQTHLPLQMGNHQRHIKAFLQCKDLFLNWDFVRLVNSSVQRSKGTEVNPR